VHGLHSFWYRVQFLHLAELRYYRGSGQDDVRHTTGQTARTATRKLYALFVARRGAQAQALELQVRGVSASLPHDAVQ
jgi:hypothetical protein